MLEIVKFEWREQRDALVADVAEYVGEWVDLERWSRFF